MVEKREGAVFALGSVLLLFLSSCAKVNQFEVAPRAACRGDTVTVRWSVASGSASLGATPSVAGMGSKEDEGTLSFSVEEPTRLVLTATGLWKDQTAEVDVEVAKQAAFGFGEVATCDEAARILKTQFDLNEGLSDAFTVGEVRNKTQRVLTVAKGGVKDTLPSEAVSDKFKSVPAQGGWTLQSPLGEGETCNEALRSIRQRLRLDIALNCGGEENGNSQ